MSLHTKVGTVWKTVKAPFVKVANSWKACKDVYVKSGGVWKSLYYTSGYKAFLSGSANFTVPMGVTSLTVKVVGGGGTGGKSRDVNYGGGGGGGGAGGYIDTTISVSPFDVLTVVVGAKGQQTLEGANGGESYVKRKSSYWRAYGGTKGNPSGNYTSTNGGGRGGAGGATSSPTGGGSTGATGVTGESNRGDKASHNGGRGANSPIGTGGAGGNTGGGDVYSGASAGKMLQGMVLEVVVLE